MKELPVVFICRYCEHVNASEMGMPNFQRRQTEFDSMTDAASHVFNNLEHDVEAVVRIEEKNE